jgi:hypothetical protein
MNATLLATLKQITTQYGMLILNDTKRLNGLLSDLAPTEPKSEKKTFVTCLMNGFHTELQNTKEDRQLCKNRLAQTLHSEEGLDLTLCNNTLDLLEAVLFGTVTPTSQPIPTQQPAGSVFCSNCEELAQAEIESLLAGELNTQPVEGHKQKTRNPSDFLTSVGEWIIEQIEIIIGPVVWFFVGMCIWEGSFSNIISFFLEHRFVSIISMIVGFAIGTQFFEKRIKGKIFMIVGIVIGLLLGMKIGGSIFNNQTGVLVCAYILAFICGSISSIFGE